MSRWIFGWVRRTSENGPACTSPREIRIRFTFQVGLHMAFWRSPTQFSSFISAAASTTRGASSAYCGATLISKSPGVLRILLSPKKTPNFRY